MIRNLLTAHLKVFLSEFLKMIINIACRGFESKKSILHISVSLGVLPYLIFPLAFHTYFITQFCQNKIIDSILSTDTLDE